MNFSTMTGLELLRASAEGKIPPASISETMGMMSMEVNEGHVVMHVKADARHLNPLGGVHGGFAATVLDSVTGCAVHSRLPAGARYATVDLSVKMLRPVPRDQPLVADAKVTHLSHSLGVSEGSLRDQDGNLLASASATCFIKIGSGGL